MQTKCCFWLKGILAKSMMAISMSAMATSCMTTYDAYGNPRQSVDPGVAVAGVAAAGLIGYALAGDNHGCYRGNYCYDPCFGGPWGGW